MASRTQQVDRVLRIHFESELEPVGRFTYDDWEGGFIRRWGLHPNDPHVSRFYLTQRQEIGLLPLIVAARAFHVNSFTGDMAAILPRIVLYENDFDKIPPEPVEEELTKKQEDEIAEQLETDEKRGRPGRTVYDMERDQHD